MYWVSILAFIRYNFERRGFSHNLHLPAIHGVCNSVLHFFLYLDSGYSPLSIISSFRKSNSGSTSTVVAPPTSSNIFFI